MESKCAKLSIAVLLWFNLSLSAYTTSESDEYCLLESFSPRCLKNEVIFMQSAIFGRMRVGRCITAEEVSGLGPIVGEDPRYLGCSEDVLAILDQKCSGQTDCEVRVGDISGGNVTPCFPGLNMYLELSYTCLTIVDEERSCTVAATENAVHIVRSLSPSRMCGTKSQPWIVEASVGKRVNLTLLKVMTPPTATQMEEHGRQPCYSHAVGCSDIIPPDDTWLKRNNDVIVIGCYSNRQTWRLSCEGGKWIGVIGNCSQDTSVARASSAETKTSISSDEQILALVAIVGCTLAICMAIICIGAVCLRRYHSHTAKKQAYKTLNYQYSNSRGHGTGPRFLSGVEGADLTQGSGHVGNAEQAPTYSVYVGDEGQQHGDLSANANYSSARL